MSDAEQEQTRYCQVCDAETTPKRTVPWQDDVCSQCANPFPE